MTCATVAPDECRTALEQQTAALSEAGPSVAPLAAKARAAAHRDCMHPDAGYLAALAAERDGYARHGMALRVALVDAETMRVRRGF